MPDIRSRAGRAVEDHDLGVVVVELRDEGVDLELAPQPRVRDVLLRIEVLVGEEEHEVFEQRRPHRGELVLVEMTEAYAPHLGAERARHRSDVERDGSGHPAPFRRDRNHCRFAVMMLPPTGVGADAVLEELDERRGRDPDVHGARLFGLVYPTGRPPLDNFLADVNRRYLFHNALNPFKFPEIASLEADVVAMTGSLVGLPEAGGGSMTSGGTESILMSMLVNRERARSARNRAAADPRAGLRASCVREGRALLRPRRRARSARPRTTEPTSTRPPS